MTERPFVDYYETLQLSPNATGETIERVYRLLAKRYHPDNLATGNADRFAEVHEAFSVLTDSVSRAAYDVRYEDQRSVQWKIFDQRSASDGREEDKRLFHGILSLLYVARRRDPRAGGLGAIMLERMLGCPESHLAFPLWYLKQHGWIEIMDNGQLAITITGVDKLASSELTLPKERLLPESTSPREGTEPAAPNGQPSVGTDIAVKANV